MFYRCGTPSGGGGSKNVEVGEVTLSTSTPTYVNLGFKPNYIAVAVYKDGTHFTESIYNKDVTTSYTLRGGRNASSSQVCSVIDLPTSSSSTNTGKILSVDNTGFTIDVAGSAWGTSAKYFAIG